MAFYFKSDLKRMCLPSACCMRLLIWIFLPDLLVERFCLGGQSPDMLGLKWQCESAAKATGKEETKEETLSFFPLSVLETLAGLDHLSGSAMPCQDS